MSKSGKELPDWSDASRTDVIKRSGLRVSDERWAGFADQEDTDCDITLLREYPTEVFPSPHEETTVRVPPEVTEALLGPRSVYREHEEATVVDPLDRRPNAHALREAESTPPRAVELEIEWLPPAPRVPSEFVRTAPPAPRVPSEFARTALARAAPEASLSSALRSAKRILVASLGLAGALLAARVATDAELRESALRAAVPVLQAVSARVTQLVAGDEPARAPAAPVARVEPLRAPVVRAPPPPSRDPSIPVVRVEDLPLVVCEGADCDEPAREQAEPSATRKTRTRELTQRRARP